MQDDLDQAVGAALRELRKAQGLSQEELAAEADIDQSLLSKVERRGPAHLGWSRFCRIARVLGHEVDIRLRHSSPHGTTEPETQDMRLKGVEHLTPTAIGWKRFCQAISAKGVEAEVLLRPSSKGN